MEFVSRFGMVIASVLLMAVGAWWIYRASISASITWTFQGLRRARYGFAGLLAVLGGLFTIGVAIGMAGPPSWPFLLNLSIICLVVAPMGSVKSS